MSFRFQSWIRNASDVSALSDLITLKAVGSELALPIQIKEPSGLTRNTSRASIVAPRRDKVTSDIRVAGIKGKWADGKLLEEAIFWNCQFLQVGRCGDGARQSGVTPD